MITLHQDTCKIALSPERGAIITSLEVDGVETLYLDQSTFDDPLKNVRGGIPVLFPICGPLRGADYRWEGLSYSLKQHGFARNRAWTVAEQSDQQAVLELADDEESRAEFPFSFLYRLTYTALANGLRIEQSIANRGAGPMPVQFGFHPYFAVGDKNDLAFDLPVTTYSDNKSDSSGPFPGFDFDREEIDWAFPRPSASRAGFRDASRGLGITLEFSPQYELLVFWTLKSSQFVCLEPWSSTRLAFPHGQDVHLLPPSTALNAQVSVIVS